MSAQRASDLGLTEWATALYALLVEQGAGDFSQHLAQLHELSKVEEYLDGIRQAQTPDERWEWLCVAWTEYPGAPKLRTAILEALKSSIQPVSLRVGQFVQENNLSEALSEYRRYSGHLLQVADAWSGSPYAFQFWTLAGSLVDALTRSAGSDATKKLELSQAALAIAAHLPAEACKFLRSDGYLAAAMEVSGCFEEQRNLVAGALLLEYALHVLGESAPGGAISPSLPRAHEYASRLYQQLELYSLAYSHLSTAHSLEVSLKVPYEVTKKMGWRCTALRNERDKRDLSAEQSTWRGWAGALAGTDTFSELVNNKVFAEMRPI